MKFDLTAKDEKFFKENPTAYVRARPVTKSELNRYFKQTDDPRPYIGGVVMSPSGRPYEVTAGCPLLTVEGYAMIIINHERAKTHMADEGCAAIISDIWADLDKIAELPPAAQVPAKAELWAEMHLMGHAAIDWAMHVKELIAPIGLLESGMSASEWIMAKSLKAQEGPAGREAAKQVEGYALEIIEEADKILAQTRDWRGYTETLRPLKMALGDALYPYGREIDVDAFKRAIEVKA